MLDIDVIRSSLGQFWIPEIYTEKIRSMRTRAFSMDIPEKANDPAIFHTLLGVEMKVGRSRVACPDLSTARYLQVFARLGVRNVAVPYDISRISAIADDLETGWQRLMLLLDQETPRTRNTAIKVIRDAIKEIGPGETMPVFDTPTRHKRPV